MTRLNHSLLLLALPATLLIAGAPAVRAQADKPASGAAGQSQSMEMPVPKPGPEHALLAKGVGKWKAVVSMGMNPGAPPMQMEGIMEVTSACGGLWFETSFKVPGAMPFEGHGIDGYDPVRKKYVGVWVDSWSTSPSTYEGTMDASGKFMNSIMTSIDPATGKEMKSATQVEFKDENTHIMRMWMTPEMKGDPMMTMTYTRM